MAARNALETKELWDCFHEVVTMTSAELQAWLATKPDLEPTPGPQEPPPLGLAVVAILRKRRTDLTPEDLDVMRSVVDIVEDETADLEPAVLLYERRRHRLLSVGHDPTRASSVSSTCVRASGVRLPVSALGGAGFMTSPT